jgi:PadR family transcriptional regulator PadR
MAIGSAKIATNLRKGVLEFCVLSVLQADRQYGVDLSKKLTAAGLIASEGTLYPLLSRMRGSGLVTTEWLESDEGRPRRYYELTPAGREQLAAFRDVWSSLRDTVDEFLEESR